MVLGLTMPGPCCLVSSARQAGTWQPRRGERQPGGVDAGGWDTGGATITCNRLYATEGAHLAAGSQAQRGRSVVQLVPQGVVGTLHYALREAGEGADYMLTLHQALPMPEAGPLDAPPAGPAVGLCKA